jgi:hypothetical protein
MKSTMCRSFVVRICCTLALAGFMSAPVSMAQLTQLPKLGMSVPSAILKSRVHSCHTGRAHYDPCTTIKIHGRVFVVAWDAKTTTVSYLFTEDPRLVTDSELSTGGSCRLLDPSGAPDRLTQFSGWVIDTKWNDTMAEVSGDSVWYAVLRLDPVQTGYGTIAGFVQSRYLNLAQ